MKTFDEVMQHVSNPPWHPEETRAVFDDVRELGLRSYVEIGSRCGDSFYVLSQALPTGSTVIAVDLPNGPWGRPGTEARLRERASQLRELGYEAHVIIGDSRCKNTIKQVLTLSPLYQLCFIDGDHSYEGVSTDWDNYGRFAEWVVFHDTCQDKVPGPRRLWSELVAADTFDVHKTFNHGWGTSLGHVRR